jgi:hypothetical protein
VYFCRQLKLEPDELIERVGEHRRRTPRGVVEKSGPGLLR